MFQLSVYTKSPRTPSPSRGTRAEVNLVAATRLQLAERIVLYTRTRTLVLLSESSAAFFPLGVSFTSLFTVRTSLDLSAFQSRALLLHCHVTFQSTPVMNRFWTYPALMSASGAPVGRSFEFALVNSFGSAGELSPVAPSFGGGSLVHARTPGAILQPSFTRSRRSRQSIGKNVDLPRLTFANSSAIALAVCSLL